jgi:hypothetical protein
MQRRMDYSPDVTANPLIAHYTHDPKTFDGFVFPTRWLVHLRDENGIVRLQRIIDDDDVAASTGQRAADRGRQPEPARGQLDLGFRVLVWADPRRGERRPVPG